MSAGLDALRQRFADPSRPVGVASLLGMRPTVVEVGRVAFEADVVPAFANPMGTVHGGILATLLDSAMGCAVQTVLDDGAAYTTLTLEVKYLRAAPADAAGGLLRAEGTVVHPGRKVVTAEGTVTDAAGRALATATTTCLVLRP